MLLNREYPGRFQALPVDPKTIFAWLHGFSLIIMGVFKNYGRRCKLWPKSWKVVLKIMAEQRFNTSPIQWLLGVRKLAFKPTVFFRNMALWTFWSRALAFETRFYGCSALSL